MSFEALLLTTTTRRQAENFLTAPSHSLIIAGSGGSGKGTIAQYIAADLLQTTPQQLQSHPYFYRFGAAEGKLISIETVREIQSLVRLKTLGTGTIRRVIVVEQAQMLTTEAQNALLKLFEEPPADTALLLTTPSLQALLPTIVSRAQHFTIQPPDLAAVHQFLNDGYSPPEAIERAYRLSEGSMGLMMAILQEDAAHPLVQALQTVKQWLGQSSFERLAQIDECIRQKINLEDCLLALQRTAQAALEQAANRGQQQLLGRWQRILQATTDAQANRVHSAQPKLLLTHLMLQL